MEYLLADLFTNQLLGVIIILTGIRVDYPFVCVGFRDQQRQVPFGSDTAPISVFRQLNSLIRLMKLYKRCDRRNTIGVKNEEHVIAGWRKICVERRLYVETSTAAIREASGVVTEKVDPYATVVGAEVMAGLAPLKR
jgi:hypothetical protein